MFNFFPKADNTAPATSAIAVTATDTTPLPGGVTRGLFVGGAGNVTLTLARDGVSVAFNNVPAGTVLPVQASIVWNTGTTATNIIALY